MITAFFKRKPGLTPAEFKAYYETTHIPLLKDITGSDFPITHKRFYLPRTRVQDVADGDHSNTAYPAPVLAGDPVDIQFDVYAELTFRDTEHLNAFLGTMVADAERLADDEEHFLDRSHVRVVRVDEPVVARVDG